MKKSVLKIAVIVLLIAMSQMPSIASVIYSNLGPDDVFLNVTGYSISSTSGEQGTKFLASQSGLFTSLDVGMGVVNGETGKAQLDLYTDSGGSPGVLLESLTITVDNPFGTPDLSSNITSGIASGVTSLIEGHVYWLLAHKVGGTDLAWGAAHPYTSGVQYNNGIIVDPYWIPAFRINTVPIPSAVWLFSSGLIGLIGLARRNV